MSENRFVLVGPARSGSTMLRVMLQKLPGARCCGESYAKTTVRGSPSQSGLSKEGLYSLRRQDDQKFLEEIGYVPQRTAGIKILYDQFFGLWSANFVRFLRENPDIKVIHLWRKDLPARYFSELLHITKALNKGTRLPKVIDHQCDADILYQDSLRLVNTSHLIDDILRDHAIHHAAYEDIRFSEEARLNLLRFLGMESALKKFKVPTQIVNPNISLVSMNLIGKDDAVRGFEERVRQSPLDVVA